MNEDRASMGEAPSVKMEPFERKWGPHELRWGPLSGNGPPSVKIGPIRVNMGPQWDSDHDINLEFSFQF